MKRGGDRLLTVREVAAVLGVCTAVVYGLVTKGELPHVRVMTNAIRFAPADVEPFVAERRRDRARSNKAVTQRPSRDEKGG